MNIGDLTHGEPVPQTLWDFLQLEKRQAALLEILLPASKLMPYFHDLALRLRPRRALSSESRSQNIICKMLFPYKSQKRDAHRLTIRTKKDNNQTHGWYILNRP